ncbi:MAG: PH domain-containing protein [Synergistaceae bacterium]|nr:PH domain-containing protein [Synergistaceae bacterium]
MAGEIKGNKTYRPAWRSFFYPDILAMIVIFVVMCFVSFQNYSFIEGRKLTLWLVALVILLLIFLHMALKRVGSYLVVRRDEVAFERGILNRQSTEIGFEDIRTVDVTQTLVQRIFNLGNISIASSGTGGYEIFVKNMPDPNVIRDEIQERKRAMNPNVGTPKPEAPQLEEAPENA